MSQELEKDTCLTDEIDNIKLEENEQVSAVLLSDGSLVDIKKYRRTKETYSNVIDTDEDDWGEMYSSGRVYRPTLNLKNLKMFSLENTFHFTCIDQKAVDCCRDWDIVYVDRKGVPILKEDQKNLGYHEKMLYDFFENCVLFDDFKFLCKQIATDFETFGFALVEMTRNRSGKPSKFYHMAPETCRIARNIPGIPGITDQKYIVQVVNRHERIFKIYDGVPSKIKDPNSNNLMTEVLLIRSYHVDGGKYGIPKWVPALKAMVGNDKVAQYNINFFENEAVPRFAVIVQGGKLDDQTKETIRSHFNKKLKGIQNAHKTLVLTSPKGTDIKLVPLAGEMKDSSFQHYRKDNRDEVIAAHRVPPHRIQVYDTGDSGTISPGSLFNIDKNYKYSVIAPLQEIIASMFNRVIRMDFKIKDKQLRFKPLDIGEALNEAEIKKIIASAHEKYYNIGAMTPDEIRSDLKLEKFKYMDVEDDVKEWASTPKPIYLLRQANMNSQGINSIVGGQGLTEASNDFDDKSKEETGRTLEDKQINNLMMKRFPVISDEIDQIKQEISDLKDRVSELMERDKL